MQLLSKPVAKLACFGENFFASGLRKSEHHFLVFERVQKGHVVLAIQFPPYGPALTHAIEKLEPLGESGLDLSFKLPFLSTILDSLPVMVPMLDSNFFLIKALFLLLRLYYFLDPLPRPF